MPQKIIKIKFIFFKEYHCDLQEDIKNEEQRALSRIFRIIAHEELATQEAHHLENAAIRLAIENANQVYSSLVNLTCNLFDQYKFLHVLNFRELLAIITPHLDAYLKAKGKQINMCLLNFSKALSYLSEFHFYVYFYIISKTFPNYFKIFQDIFCIIFSNYYC